nr:hypothetical protein [Tanacetum cinerariifolium]
GDEVIVEDTKMLFDVADDLRHEEVSVLQEDPLKESAKPKTTAASTRPNAKGLVIHEQEEAPTPTVSSQQPSQVKDKGNDKWAGDELEQERSKKQKVEDDKDSKELKKCLEIILDDGYDVTIDSTPLSFKYLTLVDYKIYKEGKKNYF